MRAVLTALIAVCGLICALSVVYNVNNAEEIEEAVRNLKKTDTVYFTDAFLESRGFRSSQGVPNGSTFSGIEPCRDGGECFSGAWLSRSEHLVRHRDLDQFNTYKRKHLLQTAVCEDSTNWLLHMMFRRLKPNYAWGTMPGQTVDVLDFSVLHLSTAGRLWKKSGLHKQSQPSPNAVERIISKLSNTYQSFNGDIIKSFAGTISENIQKKMDSTIVVITMMLSHQGLGSSDIKHRKRYVELTFWSLYPFFNNIAAYVKSQADYNFLKESNWLPFKEVILLENVPDCALPIASVLDVRAKFMQGNWSYKYVYFTEADQTVMFRNLESLYEWSDRNPDGILLPHRLVVVPPDVAEFRNKTAQRLSINGSNFKLARCCMDTGGHGETRIHWKHFKQDAVKLVQVHGVPTIMGNANFISEKYRICNISLTERYEACPNQTDYLAYGDFKTIRNHYSN